jgi:thioredoxin-like negative regulator of GroEL
MRKLVRISTKLQEAMLTFFETVASAPKAAAVETEDELPQIDETTVDNFSQEVVSSSSRSGVVLY